MSFASDPRALKDKLVRATDLDALSCRLSANAKGYFDPPDAYIAPLLQSYQQNLHLCQGYTQLSAGRTLRAAFKNPKLPLINRGTFLRTVSIDALVAAFVAQFADAQIVALGGGSDTRCFRVLAKHPQVLYAEVDFPEQTKIKKIAISNSPAMQLVLGASLALIGVAHKDAMAALDPELHTDRYHLVALDLRELETKGAVAFAFLDSSRPTLVISECVLCYMTPEQNIAILNFWQKFMPRLGVILYDPMGLGDSFGDTMAQNLSQRGLDLLTFSKYPSLHSRQQLFSSLGFEAHLTDLALIGGYSGDRLWIEKLVLRKIAAIEMIDEVEEISLLLKHYCLVYAETGLSLSCAGEFPWLLDQGV